MTTDIPTTDHMHPWCVRQGQPRTVGHGPKQDQVLSLPRFAAKAVVIITVELAQLAEGRRMRRLLVHTQRYLRTQG